LLGVVLPALLPGPLLEQQQQLLQREEFRFVNNVRRDAIDRRSRPLAASARGFAHSPPRLHSLNEVFAEILPPIAPVASRTADARAAPTGSDRVLIPLSRKYRTDIQACMIKILTGAALESRFEGLVAREREGIFEGNPRV